MSISRLNNTACKRNFGSTNVNNPDISEELHHIPDLNGLSNDKSCLLDIMENSPKDILMNLSTQKESGIIIAHLNVNSMNNKFEGLKFLVQDNIDILVLSETKLDDTYTTNQFRIEGFSSPFRADRNAHGGGLLIYVRDNIPSKILHNHSLPDNVEAIFIEFEFKKRQMASHGGI